MHWQGRECTLEVRLGGWYSVRVSEPLGRVSERLGLVSLASLALLRSWLVLVIWLLTKNRGVSQSQGKPSCISYEPLGEGGGPGGGAPGGGPGGGALECNYLLSDPRRACQASRFDLGREHPYVADRNIRFYRHKYRIRWHVHPNG